MTDIFYFDYVTIGPWTYFLAATNSGLAYVGLKGDETAPIFSYYPHKMMVRDQRRLAPYIKELREYFSGQRREFDVPLDLSEFGTPFQRSVLKMIQRIPYGGVVSYGDLATSLSNARSVRAVAHAVILNPALIFIPDHRIILASGKIGGYRLGAKEKERLIKLEKSYLHDNS